MNLISCSYLTVTLLLLTSSLSANTAKPITSCELAVASNRAAKNWSVKKLPTDDTSYRDWLNASPWCSMADTNVPNHKLILHHSSSGIPTQIGKFKWGTDPQWMLNDRKGWLRKCTVPHNYTKRKLPYVQKKPGSKCWTEVKLGPHTEYVHQWGVAKEGSKRHKKALKPMNFNGLRAGGGIRRR